LKFKIDENLPEQVRSALVRAQHDAVSVRDQELSGSDDQNLADVCRREGRALVTLDMDFADIRAYSPPDFAGLIVLRLSRQDRPYVEQVIQGIVPFLETEEIHGRLWIVEDNRIRIRGDEETDG
jgi:predicted nuclease of predicted toxin-antitoxin system